MFRAPPLCVPPSWSGLPNWCGIPNSVVADEVQVEPSPLTWRDAKRDSILDTPSTPPALPPALPSFSSPPTPQDEGVLSSPSPLSQVKTPPVATTSPHPLVDRFPPVHVEPRSPVPLNSPSDEHLDTPTLLPVDSDVAKEAAEGAVSHFTLDDDNKVSSVLEYKEPLESQLREVLDLFRDEHMLVAHAQYMRLISVIYDVLTRHGVLVFTLIRPPHYLRFNDRANSFTPIHSRRHSSVLTPTAVATPIAVTPMPTQQSGSKRSTQHHNKRVWGRTPSLVDLGKKMRRSLKRHRHTRKPDGGLVTDQALLLQLTSASSFDETRRSTMTFDSEARGLSMDLHEANATPQLLQERVLLMPHQTRHEPQGPNEAARRSAELVNIILGDTTTHAKTGTTAVYGSSDDCMDVMERRVWQLDQLPCLAFATEETESMLKEPKNNAHPYKLHPEEAVYDYSYATRKAGNLHLPIDVQVIFNSTHNTSTGISNDAGWIWFHSLVERVVNNAQIHRLRLQFSQTERALKLLSFGDLKAADKTWCNSVTKDYSLTWKLMKDGNAMCVIEGTINTPLFQCISLLNESDLHKNWIPFLSGSDRLYRISPFTQIIRQQSNLPWPLDNRESLMLAYAVDALHLNPPSIIMNAMSIPNNASTFFGLPLLAPRSGLTRLNVKFFTFQLIPNQDDVNKTPSRFIVYMDPHMPYVPKSLQSFIAKQTSARLFANIQQLSSEYRGSVYENRVNSDSFVYNIIRDRLGSFYKDEKQRQKFLLSVC